MNSRVHSDESRPTARPEAGQDQHCASEAEPQSTCSAIRGEASLDLERDVPTTAADVAMLRRLRDQSPSWFSLTASELQAILPPGALSDRPPIRHDAQPFTLP